MQKSETLFRAADVSATRKIEGLEQHEVVTLAAIGENIDRTEGLATVHAIRADMERFGFTRIALKTLEDKLLSSQPLTRIMKETLLSRPPLPS